MYNGKSYGYFHDFYSRKNPKKILIAAMTSQKSYNGINFS